MITLIADSNALRRPELVTYLRASRDHAIGLSDWTVNEMFKKNALSTGRQSLAAIARFPHQVFLLRPTGELLDERLLKGGDVPKLIDYEGSIELLELAADLQRIPVAPELSRDMLALQNRAQARMDALADEVRAFEPGMVEAAKQFTADEHAALRRGLHVEPETSRKLHELLLLTTSEFMIRNQQMFGHKPMKVREAMTMFGFRYSLCTTIYHLNWMRVGRQTGLKIEKRVNDVIDMQVAAVATFFNGVLSGDRMLRNISNGARQLLRSWGAFVGEDWIGK